MTAAHQADGAEMITTTTADLLEWLTEWAENAENHWQDGEAGSGHGWYGSGFNAWGVQTNQKYLAAMATVAHTATDPGRRAWAARRAVAALRFSLWSHRSGDGACADGQSWGHTWISALGIERMMFAVDLLDPWLTDTDRQAITAMLVSESSWIATEFHRGGVPGVVADPWNSSGKNAPESNVWNGALLWRTAARVPDHGDADVFRELACRFLINGVSVAADADDPTLVDGRSVASRHVGANFFDGYALDHHGYLNVGYMIICVSNAAMLHFDLRRGKEPAPEALHHHQPDLWHVVRRMISGDGRLLRIGGDSRVRYAYCQEYLLPALLYAADHLHDRQALSLMEQQLRTIRHEQLSHGDGSFYGQRLKELAETSPYYYTRLESDRACAVAMTIAHRDLVRPLEPADVPLEQSLSGGWADYDHGAVLHRTPERFASFSWRANGLSQGLCVPPGRGDLAEWELNLAPELVFEGSPAPGGKTGTPVSRTLRSASIQEFPGGFLTYGQVDEGAAMTIAEGWSGGPAALSHLAFAALPDCGVVLGLQHVRTAGWRPGVLSVKGLHLGIPNDVTNGSERRLATHSGPIPLSAGAADECIELGPWAVVDGALGVVGLYGSDQLRLSRSTQRRGGPQKSMFVEEVCFPLAQGPFYAGQDAALVDCGFAVLTGSDAVGTEGFAEVNAMAEVRFDEADLRAVRVSVESGTFLLVMNVGASEVTVPLPPDENYTVVGSGRSLSGLVVAAGEAVLCAQAAYASNSTIRE